MTARIKYATDYAASNYDPNRYLSPVETVEARIDEDAEQDNARDSWDGDWR